MEDAAGEWCCWSFQANFRDLAVRGFRTYAERREQGVSFFIEARAVDREFEEKLNAPIPVSITIGTGIRYCPWCGERLVDWYNEDGPLPDDEVRDREP